ncbi:hypothetical protein FA15DRAFT_263770 [Coprinopsis marcescibilis]|uniref:F-box domain-containing protein n=1 Tax=Coprinopsis marcescibilis TaxID=230819 RepID=A0A5C3L1Q6_COPMA|nr:hypothetical protein FA15DRAFT_263770 [Coprinopsis marcescibilis]
MPHRNKKQRAESSSLDLASAQTNERSGFCKIPEELTLEILSYFPSVGPLTSHHKSSKESSKWDPDPILPRYYLDRPNALRALSQTCSAYRSIFLPILWDRLEVCVRAATTTEQFFRHAGLTMIRKCDGLRKNKELASMVKRVHVILTRYKTDIVLKSFTDCLQDLPNLHTIHILHAHTQMTTVIKDAFENVTLPTVRTLIIPGYCHEVLKSCPETRSIRCIRDNGSKLVTVIKSFCKKAEELRGFDFVSNPALAKRMVSAAPNLRILEVPLEPSDGVMTHLKGIKQLSTIDILWRKDDPPTLDNPAVVETIKKLRPILLASPSSEKKYMHLCHRECDRLGGQVTYLDVDLN